MTEPKTIDITPDWDHMRAWILNIALTDLKLAIHVISRMGSEAPSLEELDKVINPEYTMNNGVDVRMD